MTKISINQQIDEVERELLYRQDVYARLVSSGKLRQSVADFQLDRMKAVLKTLQWLQTNEVRIKELLAECT